MNSRQDPKEKAEEILRAFNKILTGDSKSNNENAKKCALLCIDEILKVVPMYVGNLNPTWKFHKDVRTEIENL